MSAATMVRPSAPRGASLLDEYRAAWCRELPDDQRAAQVAGLGAEALRAELLRYSPMVRELASAVVTDLATQLMWAGSSALVFERERLASRSIDDAGRRQILTLFALRMQRTTMVGLRAAVRGAVRPTPVNSLQGRRVQSSRSAAAPASEPRKSRRAGRGAMAASVAVETSQSSLTWRPLMPPPGKNIVDGGRRAAGERRPKLRKGRTTAYDPARHSAAAVAPEVLAASVNRPVTATAPKASTPQTVHRGAPAAGTRSKKRRKS